MSQALAREPVVEERSHIYGEIDQQTFRRVLGNFASGVTVVSVGHQGKYHGSTVASFCSLSLEPPLVLVCITAASTTHEIIAEAGTFAVNILGAGSEALSRHFASREPHKFATVAHQLGQTGAPLLQDALATLECEVTQQLPGGDHSIFVGKVLAASTCDDRGPLLYFRSRYHRLS